MNSIVKFQGQKQWSVKSGKKINIDTEMNIEWISLLVSAIASYIPARHISKMKTLRALKYD